MTSQAESDPASAINELCASVGEFSQFIRSLPEAAQAEKAWGPKEALAHLVYWLESYVTQVEALQDNQTPALPDGHFDDLNAQAIKESRGLSIPELLRRYQAACDWLSNFAQTHDPANTVLVLKQGSSFQHPLTVYMTAEAGHIRWHQKILERQVSGAYLDDVEKLQETVSEFCSFIRSLPDAALVERAWGPREVLAYLVFWLERCVAQIEAAVAGKPFDGPIGRLKKLDALALDTGRGLPVDELLRRLEAADSRLRHFGQALDPQQIIVKFRAHEATLDGVILRINSHVRNHHKKLARAMT